MRESQIYVQCSKFEGYSIAVREAKVLGLPAVISHSVGIRDLVTDGKDGLCVDADASSIADGIERLINNPGLLKKLGEGAAKSFREHEDILQLLQLIKN